MKKHLKKLSLKTELVRDLSARVLTSAAGGLPPRTLVCVTMICSKDIDTNCNPNETMVGCPIPTWTTV